MAGGGGFFVTGTDTGVGKTVACAWLVQQMAGVYWKPIQAGLTGESDTAVLQRLCMLPDNRILPPVYELTHPRSPHEAAQRDGVVISLAAMPRPWSARPLIVEGAGGVMVPLNDNAFMVDLMVHLALPVVLTARTTLGTINHTLLSLECLRQRGLQVAGVILNGPPDPQNRHAIHTYGSVEILAEIPPLNPLNRSSLETQVTVGRLPLPWNN